jgi:hypothetical protein
LKILADRLSTALPMEMEMGTNRELFVLIQKIRSQSFTSSYRPQSGRCHCMSGEDREKAALAMESLDCQMDGGFESTPRVVIRHRMSATSRGSAGN